jgi:phosphoenolpyruvate carboxylase
MTQSLAKTPIKTGLNLAALSSTQHLTVARALSDAFIAELAREDADIAARITLLRDVAWDEKHPWPPKGDAKDDEKAWSARRLAVFKAVLEGTSRHALKLNEELSPQEKIPDLPALQEGQRSKLFAAYAKLGHLYEIAGLVARNNDFRTMDVVPKGAAQFIDNRSKQGLEQVLAQLAAPTFEVVMTMHPTNTNSLPMMQAMRKLAKALEPAKGDPLQGDAVMDAIREFGSASLLHQVRGADGKLTNGNFNVHDETNVVLNYLGNLYEDLPRIYAEYDEPLHKHYEAEYNPQDLKLGIKLGSWGSAGDKDGNDNVRAENTLEAIAMHTQAIVHRYKGDLGHVSGISGTELGDWLPKLQKADEVLKQLKTDIGTLRKKSSPDYQGDDGYTPQQAAEQFDALSARLREVRAGLNAGEFEQAVSQFQADQNHSHTQREAALALLRRVRTFGFNFAKIEYRETSEQYSRIVEALVPGYESLDPAKKVEKLTSLLRAPGNEAKALLDKVRGGIIMGGAAKAYSADDVKPIAYHTLKRMELARDFPDMIQDNVLAECGRSGGKYSDDASVAAMGAANMLEAVFIQRMAEKDGRKPLLGVVPLFEEPDTMQRIKKIMASAYANPAYSGHMQALSQARHGKGSKLSQQIQIAHSDNARRSGLAAARANIHEAHHEIRSLERETGIETQFFEGGSVSDAYRNGVRAISASVDDFGLHKFAKFTFQGGDLMNYFNAPSSSVRLFTRNIIGQAEGFEVKDNALVLKERKPQSVFDKIAINAMKRTLEDYRTKDFNEVSMGMLLGALNAENEMKSGNTGSRKAARGKAVSIANPSSTMGRIEPVKIDKVRTIGFSEAWQHGGILPSWIGTQELERYLGEEALAMLNAAKAGDSRLMPDERKTVIEIFNGLDAANPRLDNRQLHMLYANSPTFHDDQDRAAHAIAMTDPHAFTLVNKRLSRALKADGQDVAGAQTAKDYLNDILMRKTYPGSASLALRALGGDKFPTDIRAEFTNEQEVKADPRGTIIKRGLDRITHAIRMKSQFRDFLTYTKFQWRGADSEPLSAQESGYLHNAGDTVVHGRFLGADDPAYGRKKAMEQVEMAK